jgi:hypothetical protein
MGIWFFKEILFTQTGNQPTLYFPICSLGTLLSFFKSNNFLLRFRQFPKASFFLPLGLEAKKNDAILLFSPVFIPGEFFRSIPTAYNISISPFNHSDKLINFINCPISQFTGIGRDSNNFPLYHFSIRRLADRRQRKMIQLNHLIIQWSHRSYGSQKHYPCNRLPIQSKSIQLHLFFINPKDHFYEKIH